MPRERRRDVIRRGPAALYVVTGLPRSVYQHAEPALRSIISRELKVISVPAPERDAELYSRDYVSAAIRAAASFIIRRRETGHQDNLAPSSLTLMYVPSADDRRLLEAFEFAAFPVRLAELAVRDAQGKQLRHSPEAIKDGLRKAALPSSSTQRDVALVRERINRFADNEALLLPPGNFSTGKIERLDIAFRQLGEGKRSWSDRFSDLNLRAFTKREIPRIDEGKTRRAFQDSREMVFLTAHPTAYDGNAWDAEPETSDRELLHQLRGLYRFGAVIPGGFHHDVQRESGEPLGGISLTCGRTGEVRAEGSHANIFANDFIRAKHKEKI